MSPLPQSGINYEDVVGPLFCLSWTVAVCASRLLNIELEAPDPLIIPSCSSYFILDDPLYEPYIRPVLLPVPCVCAVAYPAAAKDAFALYL